MRVLTINELMRLTRIELCDLAQRITNELPTFPEGSPEQLTPRAYQPAQHPLRAGAAGFLAIERAAQARRGETSSDKKAGDAYLDELLSVTSENLGLPRLLGVSNPKWHNAAARRDAGTTAQARGTLFLARGIVTRRAETRIAGSGSVGLGERGE